MDRIVRSILAVERCIEWLGAGPGRTQRHLAQMLGVDIKTVNDYACRRRLPKRQRILQAIAALRMEDGPYEIEPR